MIYFFHDEIAAEKIIESETKFIEQPKDDIFIQHENFDDEILAEKIVEPEEKFTEQPKDEIFIQHENFVHDEIVAEKIIEPEAQTEAKQIDEANETESKENEEIKSDAASEKMANILKEQAAQFNKPVEANAQLPIEIKSYHTIDYFASQGIKLDALTQDKLGKQVLRFTDWLKQMKRVNARPNDLGTETDLENKVADIAADSNQPKEVNTEAMAEVLVKQGKTQQAIQLYEKLSFLHPDKSAYFASQIENLKDF